MQQPTARFHYAPNRIHSSYDIYDGATFLTFTPFTPAGLRAAEEMVDRLNTDDAERAGDSGLYCEACGCELEPVDAVLSGDEMVCCDCADRASTLNALGEPMPASEDEALARHLVGELNEMERLGIVGAQIARYDAKSAQVRALGFEIGPGVNGLELWPAGQ